MSESVENDRKTVGGLVDLHTHILPHIDDGSRSTDESIRMIRALNEAGVRYIALTPHFYAESDTPERFFARREASFTALSGAVSADEELSHIGLILGAEVQYFEGITEMSEINNFTLGDSRYLLLEMPMCRWATHMVDDILQLQNRGDIRIILAHVERYLFAQSKETVHKLLSAGVKMQANASFFTGRMSKRRAVNLLKKGYIHLLGSDCHNMTTRSPNIGKAYEAITKMLGAYAVEEMMLNAKSMLKL